MGSGNSKNGYTFQEAAKKIGRSKRTVHKYVKQGVLRGRREKGKIFLVAEDVEALALELADNLPPLSRRSFLQLAARVQRLEQDMAVLRRMNGVQGEPLRPDPENAADLYRLAQKVLAVGAWSPEDIKGWAEIFDRMDEVFFTGLSEKTGNPTSWDVFYQLCLLMLNAVAAAPEYRTSLELQELHRKLEVGRREIRGTIIAWAELGKGSVDPIVLDVLGDHDDGVLRRLREKQAVSSS